MDLFKKCDVQTISLFKLLVVGSSIKTVIIITILVKFVLGTQFTSKSFSTVDPKLILKISI